MRSRVVLAHAASAEVEARAAAARLAALGYDVSTQTKGAAFQRAHKVVVLWSRAAWGTPALRAVARRALAKGKLVCVPLDAAPPPVQSARGMRLTDDAAWRRLLSGKARPVAAAPVTARTRLHTARARRVPRQTATVGTDMRIHSESTSRAFAIMLTLFIVGVGALSAAYSRYPQVSAPIDHAAASAYAEASKIAALAP